MKILPISYNYNNLRFKNVENVTSPVVNFASYKPYAYRDMVNFGSKIDVDNFKLKAGATPDDYQLEAAKYLENGESVLVSAPTGTGKTAIAQYVMSKNLKNGERTFYTTPLKALSNQKLLEFRKIYGDKNVGILTGDRRENPSAPILVMTTEVYRNMVFDQYFNKENPEKIPKTLIFDEFHYLGDPDRGTSWEEALLFSPPDTQILGLSATIGNDKKISEWLSELNHNKNNLIHLEKRHVPLEFFDYDLKRGVVNVLDPNEPVENEHKSKLKNAKKHHEKNFASVGDYMNLANFLDDKKQLPAIFFVFNKKFSADLLEDFGIWGKDLTSKEEKDEIERILKVYENKYEYIGYSLDKDALLKGYAMHNAGILPAQKELIEELFNKKLVKVVIATETLAAGINMPAKTVLISSCEKPSSNAENGRRTLTPNEFHQMAGRAGRRGIDDIGYVYTMGVNSQMQSTFKKLVASTPNPIFSSFEPTYSLISEYHKHTKDSEKIKDILARSFKVFATEQNFKKVNSMYNRYVAKARLMQEEGFLDKNNVPTSKGKLLSKIVGYPQIPLVNLITSHSFDNVSPEELVCFAASVVGAGNFEASHNNLNASIFVKSDLARYNLKKAGGNNNLAGLDKLVQKYNSYNNKYCADVSKFGTNDEISNSLNVPYGSLVYLFAHLNKEGHSIENWKRIVSKLASDEAIKDEGSYYLAVNQTIDLLSQMIDVCNETKNIYELKDDLYYDFLAQRLKKAIKLLKQSPMQNYIYEN